MASLSFLKKALPWLGTAASLAASAIPGAGPIVGIAAKLLTTHLGKPVTASTLADTLTEALGDPAQLEAVKRAEEAFQAQMQSMNFQHEVDMETLANQDRASARTMQENTRSLMPPVLAAVAMLTLAFCLYLVVYKEIRPTAHDAVILLLGTVIAIVKDVYGYVFGSSAGSAAKDDVLAKVAQQ